MEYGASAEDIARVCHASRNDVLILCDEIGEGVGMGGEDHNRGCRV
jgi:hypothetical protein